MNVRAHARVCAYLKGSDAELDAEAQADIDVVGQEIQEHVMSAEQGDEEEGGLSQASSAHTEVTRSARDCAYLTFMRLRVEKYIPLAGPIK